MNNWIFIRGLARHSKHWWNFNQTFLKHFPEANIEMLDIRGNGDQAQFPSYLNIEDNVRDLHSRAKFLQNGPVHLLTISLGSMIGIKWTELFPKDIASLTIINTSAASETKFYQRLNLKNLKLFAEILLAKNDNFEKEKKIMKIVAQNLQNSDEVAKAFSLYEPTSLENLTRQLFAASQFKLTTKPKCPLLILGSKGDRMVLPACTEQIGKAWNQNIEWHPTAGHDIPLEEPDWVCEKLKEFIFQSN